MEKKVSTPKVGEIINGLKVTEVNGDITFYKRVVDDRLFQSIYSEEPFTVKNGKNSYRKIAQINNAIIKYNINGVYGFSIWYNNTCMEDNIWSLKEAKRIAKETEW